MRVEHASLTKLSSESIFKVFCPVCKEGVLFVRRDNKTFNLIRSDVCCLCGQRFWYTDIWIGPEVFAQSSDETKAEPERWPNRYNRKPVV